MVELWLSKDKYRYRLWIGDKPIYNGDCKLFNSKHKARQMGGAIDG